MVKLLKVLQLSENQIDDYPELFTVRVAMNTKQHQLVFNP